MTDTEPDTVVKAVELAQFIMNQSDSKPVDFTETEANSKCGCLMVQYGVANGFEFTSCGYQFWTNRGGPKYKIECSLGFDTFLPEGFKGGSKITTFGQLKPQAKEILEKSLA
jgi:hypothetical protein